MLQLACFRIWWGGWRRRSTSTRLIECEEAHLWQGNGNGIGDRRQEGAHGLPGRCRVVGGCRVGVGAGGRVGESDRDARGERRTCGGVRRQTS